jgi:hypothetical protein
MNALTFSLLAAGFASLSAFFIRKNSNSQTSSNGYFLFHYFASLLIAFAIFPNFWETPLNLTMLGIGGCVGVFNVLLMFFIAKALQRGSTGLTFVFPNVSSIFPGLLLFLVFGPSYGFEFTYLQLLGMALVICGLIFATKGSTQGNITAARPPVSKVWLKYAFGCFVVQIFALTLIQWRCLLFSDVDIPNHFLIPFALTESDDVWFMPGYFGTTFLVQGFLFLRERRMFQIKECLYGTIGGLNNGAATYLLMLATKVASPLETGLLFPCYAVATIILCNLWACKVYKEEFNFKANFTCSLGILLGALS